MAAAQETPLCERKEPRLFELNLMRGAMEQHNLTPLRACLHTDNVQVGHVLVDVNTENKYYVISQIGP